MWANQQTVDYLVVQAHQCHLQRILQRSQYLIHHHFCRKETNPVSQNRGPLVIVKNIMNFQLFWHPLIIRHLQNNSLNCHKLIPSLLPQYLIPHPRHHFCRKETNPVSQNRGPLVIVKDIMNFQLFCHPLITRHLPNNSINRQQLILSVLPLDCHHRLPETHSPSWFHRFRTRIAVHDRQNSSG